MTDTYSLSDKVAEEIRVMLARRKKSGRSLAADLGVSQTWMSERLSGKTPIDLNELARIAHALNVEPGDLLPTHREGRFITSVGSARETDETVKSHKPERSNRTPVTGYPNRTSGSLSTRRPARILQTASA